MTGSPYLVTTDDASATVGEAAPVGPPKPVEPEGEIFVLSCAGVAYVVPNCCI